MKVISHLARCQHGVTGSYEYLNNAGADLAICCSPKKLSPGSMLASTQPVTGGNGPGTSGHYFKKNWTWLKSSKSASHIVNCRVNEPKAECFQSGATMV